MLNVAGKAGSGKYAFKAVCVRSFHAVVKA